MKIYKVFNMNLFPHKAEMAKNPNVKWYIGVFNLNI